MRIIAEQAVASTTDAFLIKSLVFGIEREMVETDRFAIDLTTCGKTSAHGNHVIVLSSLIHIIMLMTRQKSYHLCAFLVVIITTIDGTMITVFKQLTTNISVYDAVKRMLIHIYRKAMTNHDEAPVFRILLVGKVERLLSHPFHLQTMIAEIL